MYSPTERFGDQADSATGIVLRRRTLVVGLALAGFGLVWAGAATWYIASRDEIALRFFATQTELRYTYEDRIGELKTRLEREITQNLVERNGFAARAEALARRQVEIESRQSWLGGLAERLLGREAALASDTQPRSASTAEPRPGQAGGSKPAPLAEPFALRPTSPPPGEQDAQRPPDRLGAIEHSLERAAAGAVRTADLLRRVGQERATQIRMALDATGVTLPRRAGVQGAVGGPLVPMPVGFDSAVFGTVMSAVDADLGEVERLAAAARTLPLARPLATALEPTSGFGYRVDPFTRSPALHTGLDLRAEFGTPVRVTAAGRVVTAEYTAGYGNLVEVDHGNGVATRYGHLSSISVLPGGVIESGQVVGRAGSTGRSTGAHLHYEVRIDGEPVNPVRFLEAGRLLGTLTP